ncbi:hypothetical protein [Sulfitobacter sp. JB4-11]|uniref:hypothetical protein n=1 Tax=Sulfitobacter rhodophyticola TaxID=3238304 RepID=UPI003512CB72
MSNDSHPVFAQAPQPGTVTLSTGTAPTPYTVTAGHGLIIVGHCSAGALAAAFDGQDVFPVLTEGGQGVLVVFVCDFAEASHGPHLEFHVTALAAPVPGATVPQDRAAALSALATQADWGVLSLHLWNDTPDVVAYNSEYLGLNARRCTGFVKVMQAHLDFSFEDQDGTALSSGKLRLNRRSDAGLMGRVLRHLGWRGLWDAIRRRPARAHVINPKSRVMDRNGRALTLTAPDKMIVTGFDAAHDRLEVSGGILGRYGFKPLIFEHLWPFRFVYVHPDDA